jgi:hypothetical protein
MKHRVYIAGAAEYASRAQAIGEAIVRRRPRSEIVSRWHRTDVEKYPAEPSIRADKVAMNVSDILRATTFVLLTDVGTPRSAWVELGIALASKIFVLWIQGDAPEQRTIFDAHGLVHLVTPGQALNGETVACCVTPFMSEDAEELANGVVPLGNHGEKA